MLTNLFNFPPV